MPKMMKREGVFQDVPRHDLPVTETQLVVPNNHMQSTDEHQAKLAHVNDTHAVRTALNPLKFGDEYAMLLGFPDGTPITVTYFHRNEPGINIRTINGELDKGDHPIHTDLTQINNFELRLVSPLEHNTNEQNDEFFLSFTAVTYPGFVPIEGDIFFMELGDKKFGECEVAEVERTTHRHGTYHRLQVNVVRYLNTEILEHYKKRVYDILTFDKTVYFNSNFSFLKHESYVTLEKLQKRRRELIQWLWNKNYSNDAKTLMRTDGIYDPYVVKFLQRIVSMTDSKKRAVQLFPRTTDYDKSIWYMLTETEYTDFPSMLTTCHTEYNNKGLFETDINYLLNRPYIVLGEGTKSDISEPYVFSPQFYAEGTQMNLLETLVYDIKMHKTINPANILNQTENYRYLDPLLTFYHIPVYIWLIDQAVLTLTCPAI
jgi:hypothetical protein